MIKKLLKFVISLGVISWGEKDASSSRKQRKNKWNLTENQNARQMEYKNELKEAVQSRERI